MAIIDKRSDDPVSGHLKEALAIVENPEARYHLREAMQLLAEEDGNRKR